MPAWEVFVPGDIVCAPGMFDLHAKETPVWPMLTNELNGDTAQWQWTMIGRRKALCTGMMLVLAVPGRFACAESFVPGHRASALYVSTEFGPGWIWSYYVHRVHGLGT